MKTEVRRSEESSELIIVRFEDDATLTSHFLTIEELQYLLNQIQKILTEK